MKKDKAVVVFWGLEKDNSKNLAYRAQIETELALLAAGENPEEYLIKHVEWNKLFAKTWQAKLRSIAVNLLPVPTPIRILLGDYVGDVLYFFLNPTLRDEAQSLYLDALAEIYAAGILFKNTIVVGYSLGSLMSANCMRDREEPLHAYIHLASPFGCSIRVIGSACRRFFAQDLFFVLAVKHLISVYSPKDVLSGKWFFSGGQMFKNVQVLAKHEEYQEYLTAGLKFLKNADRLDL